MTGARAELAPADDRHRGEPDDAQEQAHHQDLGRNEELCDQQHGQDDAVSLDRVLLADHDLVQRGEQERRDHQHRHDTWPKASDVTMAAE